MLTRMLGCGTKAQEWFCRRASAAKKPGVLKICFHTENRIASKRNFIRYRHRAATDARHPFRRPVSGQLNHGLLSVLNGKRLASRLRQVDEPDRSSPSTSGPLPIVLPLDGPIAHHPEILHLLLRDSPAPQRGDRLFCRSSCPNACDAAPG